GAATIGGTAGSTTTTPAGVGLASAVSGTAGSAGVTGVAGVAATSTLTWGGSPLEVNKEAKIAFTANIGGEEQTIEITRADVLKAGNGDGTINNAEEFAA